MRRHFAGSLLFLWATLAFTQLLPAATTTVTITTSANPVTVGQPETIVFTVKSSGSSPLTGTIGIANGNLTQIHSLVNGAYTITRAHQSGPARTETIMARYLGDSNNSPSAVATLNLVIVEAGGSATKIVMSTSANPTYVGQVTTYSAAVLGTESPLPSGTVSFVFGDGSAPSVQPLASSGIAIATHAYAKPGTFPVTATYSGDSNNPAAAAPTVGQVVMGAGPSPALTFVPVPPCRLADTRKATGPLGGPAIANAAVRSFPIPQGPCNIPATAAAYSINVTVVPGGQLNYLTVWPTGQPQPVVSLLNSIDGRVKANAAIVPAGTGGAISLFASSLAPTHVVLDINGYFVPSAVSGLAFYPLTPCRVADTRRNTTGPLAGPSLVAGQARSFPVQSSNCKIPATAQAYSFSFVGISKTTGGYVTTWPTGQNQPTVSTLNLNAATPTANAAIVPAGTGGNISVFASSNADVVLDVNGYFAPPGAGGIYLHAVTPCRALDTRSNTFPPFPGTFTLSVQAGPCAPPAAASAYVFNATVVPTGPVRFLALWPSGSAQPEVSTLNASDGSITSNMAIVPTNNGAIDSYSPDPTQLLLDLSGYFAP